MEWKKINDNDYEKVSNQGFILYVYLTFYKESCGYGWQIEGNFAGQLEIYEHSHRIYFASQSAKGAATKAFNKFLGN